MIDKVLVKERFKRCLNTYEKEAVVQNKMNDSLCKYADCKDIKKKLRVLEIGCGAGTLTKQLLQSFDVAEFYINDIVNEVVDPVMNVLSSFSFDQLNFIIGDAEEISFPDNLDMVISGSTFQWFKNLPAIFEKIYDALKSGGILIFSTFGLKNLSELRGITGKGLDYYSINELRQIASSYFEIKKLEEETMALHFSNPLEIMQHLKKTGVNAVSSTNWNKAAYFDFLNNYENYKTDKGYPLTYNPIYFIGRKAN